MIISCLFSFSYANARSFSKNDSSNSINLLNKYNKLYLT